jgi:hypothetical protein
MIRDLDSIAPQSDPLPCHQAAQLHSAHTATVKSRALAQTSPGGTLNIGGTGGLITTRRLQTATHGGDVLADFYTFKQSIAATRFMRTPSWAMHPDVIDAFYRFVASGSTSEPQIFLAGSQQSAAQQAGFGVVNHADEPHDHGSATSDLGSLVMLHHR